MEHLSRDAEEVPLISVIVPAHGRPAYLDELLQSLLHQPVQPIEVVVVDDASPEPLQVLADKRVRVVRRPINGGPAAARNTGLGEARGEWIAFADDDDLVSSDRFSASLPAMAQPAGLVLCEAAFLEGGRPEYGRPQSTRRTRRRPSPSMLDSPPPSLGQVLVRRSLAVPFEERLRTAEDIEWWIRMDERVRPIWVHEVGYLVRRHSGARPGIGSDDRLVNRRWIWDHHRDFFRRHRRAASLHCLRISASAHLLRHRWQAGGWALRSLLALPNRRGVSLLVRQVLPARTRGRRAPLR